MLTTILTSLGYAISSCIDWFDALTDATGTWGIILSVIIMFIVARLIINPFIGASISSNASDKVKGIKGSNKSNNSGDN